MTSILILPPPYSSVLSGLEANQFNSFVANLNTTGLLPFFSQPSGGMTVLAPTEAAFASAPFGSTLFEVKKDFTYSK